MLFSLNKKSLFTLYFSFLRPCIILAQANMSSGIVDADKYSVAYVTVPNTDVGKTIGHGLVKNKLAACVNVIPQITSIYEWEGKINEDSELFVYVTQTAGTGQLDIQMVSKALLMIKTRTSQVDKLTEFVRTNHPYSVCEVISLPIKNGNPPYLKWIGETVPEN